MFNYDEIIINGDSYSATGRVRPWGTELGQQLQTPVTNIARIGSNNDRITRTTIEQVLACDQNKKLLVIVGWSFIRRIEVWYYGDNTKVKSHMPDQHKEEWLNPRFITLDALANLNEITLEQKCLINEDLFVHKQLTDFYTNVYLLSQFLQNQKADYLFFSAAKNSEIPISSFPYVENLQQVQKVLGDHRIMNLHDFYVHQWALENDTDANQTTGHLSNTGHCKFANFILKKLNDIQPH